MIAHRLIPVNDNELGARNEMIPTEYTPKENLIKRAGKHMIIERKTNFPNPNLGDPITSTLRINAYSMSYYSRFAISSVIIPDNILNFNFYWMYSKRTASFSLNANVSLDSSASSKADAKSNQSMKERIRMVQQREEANENEEEDDDVEENEQWLRQQSEDEKSDDQSGEELEDDNDDRKGTEEITEEEVVTGTEKKTRSKAKVIPVEEKRMIWRKWKHKKKTKSGIYWRS